MLNILGYSAGRSDEDRWQPFIKNLESVKSVKLFFILGHAHFDKKFGNSSKILNKKFKNFSKKIFNPSNSISNDLFDDAKEFEKIIFKKKINFIILLGDRYEILNIAYLATIYNLPIIHIYGGAISSGAIDNQIRNSVSKLSHYHLVACKLYKQRLIQMGESKESIEIIGVPNISNLISYKNKFSKEEIEKKINFKLNYPTIILTVHPVTLHKDESLNILKNMFKIIEELKINCILTYPNKDIGHKEIVNELKKFKAKFKDKCILVKSFQEDLLASLFSNVDLMVGNSSSGIVESASFKLPTINIGNRQNGKLIPKNVINCKPDYFSILRSIKKSLTKNYLKKISKYNNPYESKKPLNFEKILTNLRNNKDLLIK